MPMALPFEIMRGSQELPAKLGNFAFDRKKGILIKWPFGGPFYSLEKNCVYALTIDIIFTANVD
jgi:hypothetical protein